jgi:hypothetical protein
MNRMSRFLPLLASSLLIACTTLPTGPRVMALPGTGKSLEQFRADDFECRQFAMAQLGGVTSSQAATESGLKSAAVGAAVGALAGAAIGGHQSAGVGAGTGLLVGSLAGLGAADASAYGSQRQFDHAYIQCMYAKGERVPVSGSFTAMPTQAAPLQPPPPGYPPPGYPPPGYPPPPAAPR